MVFTKSKSSVKNSEEEEDDDEEDSSFGEEEEKFRDLSFVTRRREFVTEVHSQSPVYEDHFPPQASSEEHHRLTSGGGPPEETTSFGHHRRKRSDSTRVSLCEIEVLSTRKELKRKHNSIKIEKAKKKGRKPTDPLTTLELQKLVLNFINFSDLLILTFQIEKGPTGKLAIDQDL